MVARRGVADAEPISANARSASKGELMNREDSETVGLKEDDVPIPATCEDFRVSRVFLLRGFDLQNATAERIHLDFDYGAALINALAIGKVVHIGQDVHVAKA